MVDRPHHKRAQAAPELRPTFTLKIEAKPDAGTNALKFLLKRLARQYGFKCLDAREEVASAVALHSSNRTGERLCAAPHRGQAFTAQGSAEKDRRAKPTWGRS
jgi:hypothetical protein